MMGVFGGYTRWAVVFLIIFVLFFLLCPGNGYLGAPAGKGVSVTHYDMTATGYEPGGYGNYGTYDYGESESSL